MEQSFIIKQEYNADKSNSNEQAAAREINACVHSSCSTNIDKNSGATTTPTQEQAPSSLRPLHDVVQSSSMREVNSNRKTYNLSTENRDRNKMVNHAACESTSTDKATDFPYNEEPGS